MQVHNLPATLYAPDDDVIDLRQLWRVVRHSWQGILGLCFVVSLLTTLWVMRIDPVYRASTTILIEAQEAKTVSIEEVYGMPSSIREYFLTQFKIIKNRDIAEMVANELDLWNNPNFAARQGGREWRSLYGEYPQLDIRPVFQCIGQTGAASRSR